MVSLRNAGFFIVTSIQGCACCGVRGCAVIEYSRGNDHRLAFSSLLVAKTSTTAQENPSGGRTLVARDPRELHWGSTMKVWIVLTNLTNSRKGHTALQATDTEALRGVRGADRTVCIANLRNESREFRVL